MIKSKKTFYTKDFIAEKPMQLLEYLSVAFQGKSRSEVKSYLAHRQIAVNGKCCTAFDFALQKGDAVRFSSVGEEKPNPNHKCSIVYEDADILIVNKKYGVLSMSTGQDGETTAYSLMTEHVRRRGKDNRIFIVHRLDRETSGLLMFAKNARAQEILQTNWNENVISRKYAAVVEGKVEQDSGQIVSWLTENRKSFKMNSSSTDNGGQKAVTHYKTIQRGEKFSLLELELETGRKNQIRVQLASILHPIAGDKKYGAQSNPLKRICLHARTLSFFHPVTRQKMSFDAGVPKEFL
ncbi:MAG: RluA family pseudouridine synthase [Prevotellaceae bacterium]|jgi:23S rRNA pseudouridine1911/1915/1917 synthase|nr:RluA family pseudouridine synthase [Prevotellaceae bacterium]